MSKEDTDLEGARSKLDELMRDLATVEERFADIQRELDEPTRTVTGSVKDPVIVSVKRIRHFWARLEKEPGNPVMICGTTDGRITSWRNLEDALKQANALDKEIEAVILKNERSAASGRVELYPKWERAPQLHVFGEETKAERLFADLQEELNVGLRGTPGYRLFAIHGRAAIRCIAVILAGYAFLKNLDPLADATVGVLANADNSPLIVAVAFGALVWATFWIIQRLDSWLGAAIRRYWPMVVVEIGNGRQREQTAGRVRQFVVTGSVALGVAAFGWWVT
ncbi:MAG: hypothetical protein F4Y02_02985 [Chloroflexi bacterium]|nr:hypothetical protein [Chloroflexota bacterium]